MDVSSSERSRLLAKDPGKSTSVSKFVTRPLVVTIVACMCGSFEIGYQEVVTSNTQEFIEDFINGTLTEREGTPPSEYRLTNIVSITVAILLLGAAIGSIGSSWLSGKYSRKTALWWAVLPGYISAPFYFLFRYLGYWEFFLVGRLLTGVHMGLYSTIVPIYLAEVSPKEVRGAITSLNPAVIAVATLVSQIVGFPQLFGTEELWIFAYGILLVPCVLQTLLLPFSVESPSYLMIIKGDARQAREALCELRQSIHVDDEMKELEEEMKIGQKETASLCQLFKHPPYRKPTVLVLLGHVTLQLSGGATVGIFANSLFQQIADLSQEWASYCASFIGVICLPFTVLIFFLVDVTGRRTLQLVGIAGMIVTGLLATVCLMLVPTRFGFGYASIAFVILFIVFYNIGPATIPWIMTGEYLPQEARPLASAISLMVNFFLGFIITYGFPFMQEGLGNYVLVPYIVFLIIVFIYFYLRMPETKGKTIEQIAEIFTPTSNNTLPSTTNEISYKLD